jgi:hypothetical protein
MFVIEDEHHCEWQGQYATFNEAVTELHRRAALRWDESPNVAPCTSWATCGRSYVIIEFDDTQSPWKSLRRIPAFEVSASGVKWFDGFSSVK